MNDREYLDGIPVDTGPRVKLAQTVGEWLLTGGKPRRVVTLNAVMLITALKNPMLKQVIATADLITLDGYGIILALKKRGLRAERLPGVELAVQLLEFCARQRLPVYIYGGACRTIQKLQNVLSAKWPGLPVAAMSGGFEKNEDLVVEGIIKTQPRLLLAGLGSPRQEFFLAGILPELKETVGIGVGGALEVIAGEKSRAPRFLADNGWEWFYRMLQDPLKIKLLPDLVEFWFRFLI